VRAYDLSHVDEHIHRYRRILVPIDSSRRAECSLSAGIELVRSEMSFINAEEGDEIIPKLVLATVIKPPELPIPEPYPIEINELSEQFLQVSRFAVDKYLEEMKERMPVECETYVVENSSVTSAIHEIANREDIDIVVLCAHGHSGQNNWPYGTVARNYIDHGSKPVLVIQDIPRSQVRPTEAEIAAEKSGRR
jgi:nucleotide-binding universal stress UspA family protein